MVKTIKNKGGRPRKKDAVKAGQLAPGLCRFAFIADKGIVAHLKKNAKKDKQTIKEMMGKILSNYLNREIVVKTPVKSSNRFANSIDYDFT